MAKYMLLNENGEILLTTDNLFSFADLTYDNIGTLHDILAIENFDERRILLDMFSRCSGVILVDTREVYLLNKKYKACIQVINKELHIKMKGINKTVVWVEDIDYSKILEDMINESV